MSMECQPMKPAELGRYVCVAHGGCLHSPHRTIRSDGVWVRSPDPDPLNPGSHVYSSAHRDCYDAWRAREILTGAVSPCGTCGANLTDGSGDGVNGHWQNCTSAGARRPVIHVAPAVERYDPQLHDNVLHGRDVERAQADMRRFHDAGYAVAPVPGDGEGHPYGRTCPVCTGTPDA